MNKRVLYALLLIALCVIVLIVNAGGRASISLHFAELHATKSLIFLAFLGIGVTIGILLK